MLILFLLLSIATVSQSSYLARPGDEDILNEVFNDDYADNDDFSDNDIEVDDVYYDYEYVDADQGTIPGKAGRDYPIYADIPATSFQCKGDYLLFVSLALV